MAIDRKNLRKKLNALSIHLNTLNLELDKENITDTEIICVLGGWESNLKTWLDKLEIEKKDA